MAVYDLGSIAAEAVNITDATSALANATAVVATITLPDGTTATPSVTNSSTGVYQFNYQPTQVGRHTVAWIATGSNASSYYTEFTVRDPSQISIVSLDEVKSHLNILTTNNDDELRRMMDAATDLCQSYTGTILGRVTFNSEIYDGNVDTIRIYHPRVLTILSVYENDVLLDPSAYSLDYTGQRLTRVTTGSLSSPNYYGIWAQGVQNIIISYVAGYINPPPAIKQGILETIRHLWQTQRGTVNVLGRNQTGDEGYASATFSLPRRVMELLDTESLPGLI
jgi:hypothetical protein